MTGQLHYRDRRLGSREDNVTRILSFAMNLFFGVRVSVAIETRPILEWPVTLRVGCGLFDNVLVSRDAIDPVTTIKSEGWPARVLGSKCQPFVGIRARSVFERIPAIDSAHWCSVPPRHARRSFSVLAW